jgi:hypothetical protein
MGSERPLTLTINMFAEMRYVRYYSTSETSLGCVWLVPTLALSNIWQELVLKFLVKLSLCQVRPVSWPESVSEKGRQLLAAKILATNQTVTKTCG